ncbi:MAG: long-chain-fatty-acid--CoA ligase [Rhodospirillaceae bacterium]|nr:MAG: long-chain-fatty-acid--CoA ligase [Rhodospirillaceae bacterium]
MTPAFDRCTIPGVLREQAALYPDAVALIFEGRSTTYAELERRTNQIANAFRAAGLRPGDRVAHLGKNSDRFFELLIGAAKAQVIFVPLNWRLARPELQYVLRDAEPTILFVGAEFISEIDPLTAEAPIRHIVALEDSQSVFESYTHWYAKVLDTPPESPPPIDQVVLIMYTSGTTGWPKGAMLSHRSVLRIADSHPIEDPEWFVWTHGEVALIAMPTFHIGGTGQGLRALKGGASAVILREFAVDTVLAAVAQFRVNKLFLVPSAIQAVIQHPSLATTDYSCLRYILYGASPIPIDLLRKAMTAFGCRYVQMYGSTETSGTVVALSPEDHVAASNSLLSTAGRALPGVEIKIIDEEGRVLPVDAPGEIVVRSVANMVGYWRLPDETAKAIDTDGWLRTGDIGSLDADGYLRVRDRLKDMIISGGENVYPAEVENAIYGHPAVSEVAVIGLPHPRWGEAVTAIVVPKAGFTGEGDAIIAWARARIAAYKAPKTVHFVESLPRNASGKILRRSLRDTFSER